MAYVTKAQLRPDTYAEFATGLALKQSEASDARLDATIARVSQRIDDVLNDHFSQTTPLTLNIDVKLPTDRLVLPRRCTALTSVSTRDSNGNLTLQASSVYRLNSSLDSAGAVRLNRESVDSIDIIEYGAGISATLGGPWVWPCGTQAVQVIGTFDWTTTPADIQRLVALLVFDQIKEKRADLGRIEIIQNANETVRYRPSDPEHPFGITEADEIAANYMRRDGAWVRVW